MNFLDARNSTSAVAPEPSSSVTISPWLRGGRASAWFAGARRPVRIVNMDLLAIEIGESPAKPGDRVELMGPNLPLDDLAAATDTVAHECLVRLSGRARRRYVRS